MFKQSLLLGTTALVAVYLPHVAQAQEVTGSTITNNAVQKSAVNELELSLTNQLNAQSNKLTLQEINLKKIVEFELDAVETAVDSFVPKKVCQCSQSVCPPPPGSGGGGGGGGGSTGWGKPGTNGPVFDKYDDAVEHYGSATMVDQAPTNCCFIAGTAVTMVNGKTKPIEQIVVGDQVIGQDGITNTVIKLQPKVLGDRCLYSINGSKPFVTPEHPFLTTQGWKAFDHIAAMREIPGLQVGQLTVGDILITKTGKIVLQTFDTNNDTPKTPVYNFTTNGNNSYIADEFVVHNKGGGGGSVICTELNAQGLLSDEFIKFEQAFLHQYADPYAVRFYHFWGKPYVKLMRKSRFFTLAAVPFANIWAEYFVQKASGGSKKANLVSTLVAGIIYPAHMLLGRVFFPNTSLNYIAHYNEAEISQGAYLDILQHYAIA